MNLNIFREYDIRGIVGEHLTNETVEILAKAIGTYFVQNGAKRIAIGFDARVSSPIFQDILVKGFNECGIDCVLIGRVPTPVLYFTVFTQNVDGGVMITGSHNPPHHNGFKICLGKTTIFGSQINEIKEIAVSGNFAKGKGKTETLEILDEYKTEIEKRVNLGNRRLKVVIDAGNGMGGITAVPIYKNLGIDLVELFTEPDSNFPNHHPDPTVEENLQDIIAKVIETKADIGIAFDGDADRIGIVNEKGEIIWGDELTILYAREILRENPNATIIAEVKCSQTLYDEIEKLGGNSIMCKAGHSIIKAKMKETNALLAGEMSGHIFFADKFYGFDDACYAGLRVLEILSKTDKNLSELLADLPKTFSTPEIRIDCSDETKFDVVEKIADYYSKTNKVITIDGARIIFEKGWGLVRASNTQAILVLRFEADSSENLQKIRTEVEGKLSEFV
jgi:phosphomannomutase / phosphoglucomutase